MTNGVNGKKHFQGKRIISFHVNKIFYNNCANVSSYSLILLLHVETILSIIYLKIFGINRIQSFGKLLPFNKIKMEI